MDSLTGANEQHHRKRGLCNQQCRSHSRASVSSVSPAAAESRSHIAAAGEKLWSYTCEHAYHKRYCRDHDDCAGITENRNRRSVARVDGV
jgi:hypothetical protein